MNLRYFHLGQKIIFSTFYKTFSCISLMSKLVVKTSSKLRFMKKNLKRFLKSLNSNLFSKTDLCPSVFLNIILNTFWHWESPINHPYQIPSRLRIWYYLAIIFIQHFSMTFVFFLLIPVKITYTFIYPQLIANLFIKKT